MKDTGRYDYEELSEPCPCKYVLHRGDGSVDHEATQEFKNRLEGLYYMTSVFERVAKKGEVGEFSIRHLYFTGRFAGERIVGRIVPMTEMTEMTELEVSDEEV